MALTLLAVIAGGGGGCYHRVVGTSGSATGNYDVYQPNLKETSQPSTPTKTIPTKKIPTKVAPPM